MNLTLDHHGGLVISVPEIGDHLERMSTESKQLLATYLAMEDDIFTKIVSVLADGFCTPSEDDTRWWSPYAEKRARALLDSRLSEVAERRIEDLKSEVARLAADVKRAEEWKDAYWEVAAVGSRNDYSAAHAAALAVIDHRRAKAAAS